MKKLHNKKHQDIINRLNSRIYSNLKPIRIPLILIQTIFLLGSLGYVFIDNFSIMDAIYQTGITFTTVGFGEIDKISPAGRMFTLVLIISGFAVFTFVLAILSEFGRNGIFQKLIKEKKMLKNIIQLHQHFVIYYYNEYTRQVIEQFKINHVPFVVVDPDPEFEQIAIKNKYPYYIIDQPHIEITHLKCNLASAKGVIILSKNASDNIAQIVIVRLYERELKREPYYISSYGENSYDVEKLKKLGANQVLSPGELLARKIGVSVLDPKKALTLSFLEEIFYKKNSQINISEFVVSKTSWVALKKIKETFIRDLVNVNIIGLTNKNTKFISMPKREECIGIGSKLLLMGSEVNIKKAKKIMEKQIAPKYVDEQISKLYYQTTNIPKG